MPLRKCDHWLNSFVEWTRPRSEVQESFLIWSGLFALSSALRRRVWIPREYLGSWECYPYLYIILVAPPGMRKTTSLNYALELFEDLPELHQAPNTTSQAALALTLTDSKDCSAYIVSEEFSDLLIKSGKEMYEFLTSIFDGRKKYVSATISRGIEFLERPCLNMAAGTTPIWISNNLPVDVIGGGFASRCIFIFEDTLRRKKMYHMDVDYKELSELKSKLVYDLDHISRNITGKFKFDNPSTLQYMEEWYQDLHPQKYPTKLQGYYTRKHVHLHKVAMLWHLSYSDELVLTKHDFDSALGLLELIEDKLPLVFEGVGKNIYVLDIKAIYLYIKREGRVTRAELLDQFQSAAEPNKLLELINMLVAMRKIEFYVDEGIEMVKVVG
jgi:hypothetical protein